MTKYKIYEPSPYEKPHLDYLKERLFTGEQLIKKNISVYKCIGHISFNLRGPQFIKYVMRRQNDNSRNIMLYVQSFTDSKQEIYFVGDRPYFLKVDKPNTIIWKGT